METLYWQQTTSRKSHIIKANKLVNIVQNKRDAMLNIHAYLTHGSRNPI